MGNAVKVKARQMGRMAGKFAVVQCMCFRCLIRKQEAARRELPAQSHVVVFRQTIMSEKEMDKCLSSRSIKPCKELDGGD